MSTYDFPHRGREYTGRWMYWLADTFAGDLGALGSLSLPEFHRFVARIPYKADPEAWKDAFREVVARPAYIFEMAQNPEIGGIDCKKKAILIGAWSKLNGKPWEFVAMSERPDKEIHHVFPLVQVGNRMVNADATYSRYYLGEPKSELTAGEILPR